MGVLEEERTREVRTQGEAALAEDSGEKRVEEDREKEEEISKGITGMDRGIEGGTTITRTGGRVD
jgi:hypothetical protein